MSFFKITETARWEPLRKTAYSEHSILKAGYVTAVLAIVRAELRAREASSCCDKKKWPHAISPYFTLFGLKQTFVFLRSAW